MAIGSPEFPPFSIGGPIGGFEFALDGMLNVHASGVKYRKPTVALRKCNVPRPFVGKISSTRMR